MWSFGVTLHEMTAGAPPFIEETDPIRVLVKIATSDMPPLPSASLALQALASAALTRDPAARPSAADLLLHPFLSDEDALR